MTHSKTFWLAAMAGLLAFYAFALAQGLQHGWTARPALVALIFLAAHLLEIPLAFRKLRGREVNPARVIAATFVFGLLWWIPASRGVLKAA